VFHKYGYSLNASMIFFLILLVILPPPTSSSSCSDTGDQISVSGLFITSATLLVSITIISPVKAAMFLYLRRALDTMLSSCGCHVCVKHSGRLIRAVRLRTGRKTKMAAFYRVTSILYFALAMYLSPNYPIKTFCYILEDCPK
jgi:hypothetical protein